MDRQYIMLAQSSPAFSLFLPSSYFWTTLGLCSHCLKYKITPFLLFLNSSSCLYFSFWDVTFKSHSPAWSWFGLLFRIRLLDHHDHVILERPSSGYLWSPELDSGKAEVGWFAYKLCCWLPQKKIYIWL